MWNSGGVFSSGIGGLCVYVQEKATVVATILGSSRVLLEGR